MAPKTVNKAKMRALKRPTDWLILPEKGIRPPVVTGAASLSNMGPLLDYSLPESGLTYAGFNNVQKIISAIIMLIGRVEVLAVLVIFAPSFWQR